MAAGREKGQCCGCGACADVCRVKAIRMVPDGEGFSYPQVDRSVCVDCGQCERVCPVRDGAKRPQESKNQYFGVRARSEELRCASSSGGFFPILAQYVLDRGGVVYGAGYDSDMNVAHREIGAPQDLEQVQRTRYVQSDMTGVYIRIEGRLKEGRWVLYCGTACQAQALRLFLGKDYERLIVADLVCYGVPSPGIWRDYVRFLEKRHGGKMTDFSFRDKRNRDSGHTCSYRIGGEEHAGSLYEDPYCRLYFRNWILRPSCHSCRFCTTERDCDFTMGDFWGIERVRPDMDDGMGTSMVIAHTEKAGKVWEEVKKEVSWFACEREELLQPRLTEPTGEGKGRRIFMSLYRVLPFSFIIRVTDKWMNRRRMPK